MDRNNLLVSGPVVYTKSDGFWQRIVTLDYSGLVAIGAAYIEWHLPMICNGANLAYRKSLVSEVNLKENKASGDDVFILQSAFEKNQSWVVFSKNRDAFVMTEPPSDLKVFWNQRIRWASKNSDYSIHKNTLILVFVWLYNVMIVISLLSLNPLGLLASFFLVLVN